VGLPPAGTPLAAMRALTSQFSRNLDDFVERVRGFLTIR
jgi:hypothetical protein